MYRGGKQDSVLRQSRKLKFGVEHHWQDPAVKTKRIQTWKEKLGVENPAQSPSVKEQTKLTCISRYGKGSGFSSPKTIETVRRIYGVDNAAQSLIVQSRMKQTMVERYGVDNAFKLPTTRLACNSPAARQKMHETMKRNGTYNCSRVEDAYYRYLCSLYGEDDVIRWVSVNGWSIDIMVKSENQYVQVDGVYWHGLDRPVDVIQQFMHPRDVQIYGSYCRDIAQNEWFNANELSLKRVTDIEVKELLKCAF